MTFGDYERIEQAIQFLEHSFQDQPDLKAVAEHVGLSEFHFQRLFKRWAGVSPKRFLQFLTVEHAKRRLRESKSVLHATYESGLSSPGRLHDHFVAIEAVTPGEFKNSGRDLSIRYGFHTTRFGDCMVALTDRGICGLEFVIDDDRRRVLANLQTRWKNAQFREDAKGTKPTADRISTSTNGNGSPVRLFLQGTNFQIQVWQALLGIPVGMVCSYQDVARLVCSTKAARAVGHAVGQNPVAFLIPCHRVIRNIGAIGGYRWGTTRKKAIIAWESAVLRTLREKNSSLANR